MSCMDFEPPKSLGCPTLKWQLEQKNIENLINKILVMKERTLEMQADITPDWEDKMQQVMDIPCVHSVTWQSAERIEITYIEEPTKEQQERIKEIIK
jgi:hypothetical protein